MICTECEGKGFLFDGLQIRGQYDPDEEDQCREFLAYTYVVCDWCRGSGEIYFPTWSTFVAMLFKRKAA